MCLSRGRSSRSRSSSVRRILAHIVPEGLCQPALERVDERLCLAGAQRER